MTRRSKDSSTVATGESSLRNLAYEPSIQESMDDEQTHSDGESALSSVVSSLKRDLKARACHGAFSSHSVSTSQSKSTGMWQDSDSDAELYTTDEEPDNHKERVRSRSTKAKYEEARLPLKSTNDQTDRQDSDSLESTEDPTTESDSSHGGDAAADNCAENVAAEELEANNDISSESAGPTHPKTEDKPKTPHNAMKSEKEAKKARRKKGPRKCLRFSQEAIAEVAKTRVDGDRHELRPKWALSPESKVKRLENVDYVSHVDVASSNQDISTFHPLDKEDCDPVFHDRVPYEVPMPPPSFSYDDMSSIHALSTRLPIPTPGSQEEEEVQSERDDVEKAVTKAIPDIIGETMLPFKDGGATPIATARQRRWTRGISARRNDGELLFATVAGVSLATLVILIVLLFAGA
jgi:hypothetical protein